MGLTSSILNAPSAIGDMFSKAGNLQNPSGNAAGQSVANAAPSPACPTASQGGNAAVGSAAAVRQANGTFQDALKQDEKSIQKGIGDASDAAAGQPGYSRYSNGSGDQGGLDGSTKNNGGISTSDGGTSTTTSKTLTLQEQRVLAAYCQYSLPLFYIPPLLVTDTGNAGDVGKGVRAGFIFINIGDLKIEDGTFPRNVPILKVPDGDIDAVQDLGFGSGNIKVSGRLWNEGGYRRLQTLRELCKSRRPLIWISQETGPWYVFPLNVPGVSTDASKPHQYFFEVTFVCVAQLNEEDPVIKHYNNLRQQLVKKKMDREMAWTKSQNTVQERIKDFSGKTGAGSGIQKGYYWDITTGAVNYNPDAQDLKSDNFQSEARTSGDGGAKNTTAPTQEKTQSAADASDARAKNINKQADNIQNEFGNSRANDRANDFYTGLGAQRDRMADSMNSGKPSAESGTTGAMAAAAAASGMPMGVVGGGLGHISTPELSAPRSTASPAPGVPNIASRGGFMGDLYNSGGLLGHDNPLATPIPSTTRTLAGPYKPA